MKNRLYHILLSFALVACTQVDRVNTTAVKDQMNNYKIRKIKPSDFLAQAKIEGEKLKNSIDSSACNLNLIDSLAQNEQIEIKIYHLNSLPPIADTKLSEIMEAYRYAAQQGQEIPDNYQALADDKYNYCFKPKCAQLGNKVMSVIFTKEYLVQAIQ